jgi:hypothetical protein
MVLKRKFKKHLLNNYHERKNNKTGSHFPENLATELICCIGSINWFLNAHTLSRANSK